MPLPVPELPGTLTRAVTAVLPVTDGPTARATEETFHRFISEDGPGPALQERLLDFAAERAANGSSWLAGKWLSDYLTVRGPLPLATNVAFQFRLATQGEGLDRIAEALHRIASLHLLQAGGMMPLERDARGNVTDPGQWECLAGGIRMPADGEDQVLRDLSGRANREIGVSRGGRMWAVRVSDADGHPLPVGTLREALAQVAGEADGAVAKHGAGDFLTPSYLGSGWLAENLPDILATPSNEAVYDRLVGFLTCVNLIDQGDTGDAELLRACAFEPGHAWVHKPVTYEFALDGDWSCLHVEHSTVDGATLAGAIGRLQATTVMAGEEEAPAPEQLTWGLDDAQAEHITAEAHRYAEEAGRLTVQVVTVDRPEPPFKASADGLCQLILTVAQQMAFGRVRGVYEAVDMREYLAGRTECLRAATLHAVWFACECVTDPESERLPGLLRETMGDHRAHVKMCKAGRGFDRHLWALRFIAEEEVAAGRLERMPELFDDPGLRAAQTDFLSTTSIGADDRIIRYAFAPTVDGGFGVNYTPKPGAIEYCVTYDRGNAEAPAFLAALPRAAEAVCAVSARMVAE